MEDIEWREMYLDLKTKHDELLKLNQGLCEELEIKHESYYIIPSRVIDINTRFQILKDQKWKCNVCSISLKFNYKSKWEGVVGEIDHIHPYSQATTYINGPSKINERTNLQGLCPPCNKIKSDKLIH